MQQLSIQHMTALLRFTDVTKKTGLSRTTIDRLEKAGKFPRRRKLGIRAIAWDEQEIQNWINSKPTHIYISAAGNPSSQEPSK